VVSESVSESELECMFRTISQKIIPTAKIVFKQSYCRSGKQS